MSDKGLKYRVGIWGIDSDVEELSNWKEFENSIMMLEEEGDAGQLFNASVFLFTDNTTVEACLYKGTSSSPKLFDLAV